MNKNIVKRSHSQWEWYWKEMKKSSAIRLEAAIKLDQASVHRDGTLCYVDNNCKLCVSKAKRK